jgi:hypothetical protein
VANKKRRRRGIFLGVATAVAMFTVVDCSHTQEAHKGTGPATSAPPAAVLDGTYRVDFDGAKTTLNGAPVAPSPNTTFWYAFRSACGSSGCAATATGLDDNNHQVALTPASTDVLYFVDGHWKDIPTRHQDPFPECLLPNGTIAAGEDTRSVTWSFAPQPDGTLSGAQVETTVTNDCGIQGGVFQSPMVLTRVGDVPAGVAVVDPTTVGAPAPPAPTVAGPVLNGTYRLDFDFAHETRNGASEPSANETHWWAFRSLCTSSGCVATGSKLSDTNQQEAAKEARVLRFANGHWQDTPYLRKPQKCRRPAGKSSASTESWSWEPQPDGTLPGVWTRTVVTNECGDKGTVFQAPMVVTRVGDAPANVPTADPTLFF